MSVRGIDRAPDGDNDVSGRMKTRKFTRPFSIRPSWSELPERLIAARIWVKAVEIERWERTAKQTAQPVSNHERKWLLFALEPNSVTPMPPFSLGSGEEA